MIKELPAKVTVQSGVVGELCETSRLHVAVSNGNWVLVVVVTIYPLNDLITILCWYLSEQLYPICVFL